MAFPTKSPAATPAATPLILPKTSNLSINFANQTGQTEAAKSPDPFAPGVASKPVRILAYGRPKTRKTWWATTAANAGLRVTILDGDTNTGILNQLPPESLSRVQVAPMAMIGYPTIFPQFIAMLSGKQGRQFAFPIDGRAAVNRPNFNKPNIIRPDMTYLLVNLDALTTADLIIVDSYTTLIAGISHIYNRDRDIDPMKGEILDESDSNKYRYFRYHEAVVKELMSILRELPCNIIITAHAAIYETEIMVGKSKQRFGNIQIVSYSGTDGARAPALCSDVLYFEPKTGQNTHSIIHATSEDYRIGGCTHIPPGSHEFPGSPGKPGSTGWDFTNFLADAKLSYPTAEQADAKYGPWLTAMSGQQMLDTFG